MHFRLIAACAAASLVLAGCGSMESLGSDEEVVAAAQQGCRQLDQKNRITSRYDARMRVIRQGLPTHVGGQVLNYKVYDTKEMNAFAMPNGCVRVYSALLDKLTDDEVRAVLGHEIGHVALRHSVQQYRTNRGVALTVGGLSAMSSVLTGGAVNGEGLAQITYSMVNARYSQNLETEADNYSVDLLLREPDGKRKAAAMGTALQKITSGGSSGMMQKMFGSHPDPASRIANVKKRVENAK